MKSLHVWNKSCFNFHDLQVIHAGEQTDSELVPESISVAFVKVRLNFNIEISMGIHNAKALIPQSPEVYAQNQTQVLHSGINLYMCLQFGVYFRALLNIILDILAYQRCFLFQKITNKNFI